MATDLASLTLRIDSDQVQTGEQRLEGMTEAARESEQASGGLRSGWQRFSQTVVTLNQGLQLAERVFGRVNRTVQGLRQAFEDNEQAAARVEAVLNATGGAAGLTARELESMATELSNVTGIAGQTITEAQAIGLTFRQIGGDIFPEVTERAADIATVMGTDMRQAMQQVAFAVNDPVEGLTRLRRSGIQFSETQQELIRNFVEMGEIGEAQRIVLQEIEQQFGGAAREMRDTARGSRMAYEEAIDGLRSALGEGIENILRPGRERFIEWVNANLETIQILAANAPEVMAIMGRGIRSAIGDIFSEEGLRQIGEVLIDVMSASALTSAESLVNILGSGFDAVVAMAETLGENWAQAFINAWVSNIQRGPRALLNFMGIEVGEWVPFDIDTSLADAAIAGLSTGLEGLGQQFMQNLENLRDRWEDVSTGFRDVTSESIAQITGEINELIERAREAAEDVGEIGTTEFDPIAAPEGTAVSGQVSEIDRLIQRLEREVELRDASREAVIRYDIANMDATETQREAVIALAQQVDALERREELERRAEEVRRSLMTAEQEYVEQARELWELVEEGVLGLDEYTEAVARLREEFTAIEESAREWEQTLENIEERLESMMLDRFTESVITATNELGRAFAGADDAAQSLGEAIGQTALRIIQDMPLMLFQAGVAMLIQGAPWPLALGFMGAGIGLGIAGGAAAELTGTANARGNVYDSSGLVPFASGGVVSSPTVFPFAGGVGLMGEAGPEAIMPLQRGPTGELGVRSSGGALNLEVVINNHTASEVDVDEQRTSDGHRLMLTIRNAAKEGAARGDLDSVMATRFGVRRRGQ